MDLALGLAFEALDLVATPSGHFEEAHGADLRPQHLAHRADGTGSDAPARFRPWEGGIVASSVWSALLDLRHDAAGGRVSVRPGFVPGRSVWRAATRSR